MGRRKNQELSTTDILLPPLVETYLNDIVVLEGLEPKTAAAYANDLKLWLAFLTEKRGGTSLLKSGREDVTAFGNYCQKVRGNSPVTWSRKLASIRGFETWLAIEGYRDTAPSTLIGMPKKKRREKMPPSDVQMGTLLNWPLLDPADETGLRDHTLMVCMSHQGLRREECSRLSWSDISFEQGNVLIRGKGGHNQVMPLNPRCGEALMRLHDLMDQRGLAADAVFVALQAADGTVVGDRLSEWSCSNIVLRRAKAAGLKRITAHSLRHWFGTTLNDRGASTRDIQELMRHADIGSTQVYVHASRQRQQALIATLKVGPRRDTTPDPGDQGASV